MSKMQKEPVHSYQPSDLDLGKLLSVLWRRKLIVAALTTMSLAASLTYAFLAAEWYRAEVLLAPSDSRSSGPISAQLGGLLSLAGRNIDSGTSAEALAVLQSRELARNFINDLELLQVIFEKHWDPVAKNWLIDDPADWPDIRDAVDLFHSEILAVNQDRETSLISLSVSWTDPRIAADWANELVRRVNDKMRSRALSEAQLNIAFLTEKLASTNIVALQQSISTLLEAEMQKLMLAQGTSEFSFRVIDPAQPPKYRSRPDRVLIGVAGAILGFAMGILIVLIGYTRKELQQLTGAET